MAASVSQRLDVVRLLRAALSTPARTVPTFGDLVGLKPRHIENVCERFEVVALGKPRQILGQRGNVVSGTGCVGRWTAILGGHSGPCRSGASARHALGVDFNASFYTCIALLQLLSATPGS